MALTSATVVDIALASICATLILSRCAYRAFHWYKGHRVAHRVWHVEDAYMAFALIPLISRTVCVSYSFALNPSHTHDPPTEDEAAAQGVTVEQLRHARIVGIQLLIGTRLSYALLLWCLKAVLLSFYSRFLQVMTWGRIAVRVMWCVLVLTYLAVLIATLAECRPISLMWMLSPKNTRPACSSGMVYFVTMAACNFCTDVALLILPFPTLLYAKLNTKEKLQLAVLFSIGILLITITIVRVPLILNDSMSQRSRSMWATIEIVCACIVANTAFYYGIIKDLQHKQGELLAKSPRREVFYRVEAFPTPNASKEENDVQYQHREDRRNSTQLA